MGFLDKMFSKAPVVEAEPQYSVKKLIGFLNEWTSVAGDEQTAHDNKRRDKALAEIIQQVGHLEKSEIEKAYIEAKVSEIHQKTLEGDIYRYEKSLEEAETSKAISATA